MGEAVTAAELLYGMPLLRSVTGGDGGGGGGAEPGGCGALLAELKVCGCVCVSLRRLRARAWHV